MGGIKAAALLKMNLLQESNGSVKAFESFHNVEREKIESPSRSRWDSLMRKVQRRFLLSRLQNNFGSVVEQKSPKKSTPKLGKMRPTQVILVLTLNYESEKENFS